MQTKNMMVLLVDGRKRIRARYRAGLKAMSLDVIEAETGGEALLTAWHEHVSSIVIDMDRQAANIDMLTHIRGTVPKMPIFLLLHRGVPVSAALDAMADRLYEHPADPEQLANEVYLACMRYEKARGIRH